MINFTPGQRWISQTEPELGLGVLIFADHRTLQLRFDASECTRTYTLAAAPIQRITFKPNDTIRLKDGSSRTVLFTEDRDGLVYYRCNGATFCETELSDTIFISLPQERLLAGLTDTLKLFNLRFEILRAKALYNASGAKGFLGGQVDLLPHQLYIADTVTQRFIPRVLLSDETGLGKTIEACLILHKLLVSHKVSRILIIVPQALIHQWFIELYRKFNLSFMIFSESYCTALENAQPGDNPYSQHQLGIVGLDSLKSPTRHRQMVSAGWDIMVVDEAHHITDSEIIFTRIKSLAADIRGLMLLTATPEQMGQKNHFRHLQLIDPEKYFDYHVFQKEADKYEKTASIIKNKKADDPSIEDLLDTYGPGRVIFKNRRSVVKGFPKRICRMIPLEANDRSLVHANREFTGDSDFSLADDPRINCLVTLIKQHEKILVIGSTKEKAAAIEAGIAKHIHIPLVRFDESMTLIQRDRHAAFFARPDGARVLICSEIGSEGRNFQFVHHLFLFDLPMNPELLEQRIGRLDRIGQQNDIQIWVPFIEHSVFHILAMWYSQGLQIFEHHVDGAAQIFEKFRHRLNALITETDEIKNVPQKKLSRLLEDTRRFCIKTKNTRDKGQNILLQLNSFKPEPAAQVIDRIKGMEKSDTLMDILVRVLDHFGIEVDFFSAGVFKFNSQALTDEGFPLPEHLAAAMTFDRQLSVIRDELDLITWDHTFVHQTFEYFLTNHIGSCSTARLTGQKETGLLLEAVFILECVAPLDLNMDQYLQPEPIRIIVNHHCQSADNDDVFTTLSEKLQPDNPTWFKEMDEVVQTLIPSMVKAAEKIAARQSEQMIVQGKARIEKKLTREIDRLISLQKINPGIGDEEIRIARDRKAKRLMHIENAFAKLDSLRLIRCMP